MVKKQGAHIFWFQDPLDPDGFKPTKSKSGDLLPSLWAKVKDDALQNLAKIILVLEKQINGSLKHTGFWGGEFQVLIT